MIDDVVVSPDVQRPPAEVRFADELARLREADDAPRPPGWALSLRAARAFVVGDESLGVTRKFVGDPSLIDRALVSLATSRGLLLIDPRRQSTIETPAVVNRGDSGCALLDRDDKVLGFAFRRTGYGAAIEFADWIWAANAMAALELEPL